VLFGTTIVVPNSKKIKIMNKKCPYHKIKIPENREIVKTDKLKFPWKQDPRGYFLVKIKNDQIYCGFVSNKHKMKVEFKGKDPDKIIKEIAKRKLVGLAQMGYIASELMIAKNCLKNNPPSSKDFSEASKKYIQR